MSRDLIDRQEIIGRLDRVIEKGLVSVFSGEHPITAEVMKRVIEDLPSAEPEIIRCKDCKYYEGVHNIQGHAPCSYWKAGGVLWNWFCSQAERRTDE